MPTVADTNTRAHMKDQKACKYWGSPFSWAFRPIVYDVLRIMNPAANALALHAKLGNDTGDAVVILSTLLF
jgi:hypothetical protein